MAELLQNTIQGLLDEYYGEQERHQAALENLAAERDFAKSRAYDELKRSQERIKNLQDSAVAQRARVQEEMESSFQRKVLQARQSIAVQKDKAGNRRHDLEILLQKMPAMFRDVAPAQLGTFQIPNSDDVYLNLLNVMYEFESLPLLKQLEAKKRANQAAAEFLALIQAELLNIEKSEYVVTQDVDLASMRQEHEVELEAALRKIDMHENEHVDRTPFDQQADQADRAYEERKAEEERRHAQQPAFHDVRERCMQVIAQAKQDLDISPEALARPYAPVWSLRSENPLFNVVLDAEGFNLDIPYLSSLDRPEHLWLYVADEDVQDTAMEGFRAIVAQYLRAVPFGQLRVYWFDPSRQGMTVQELAPLADELPKCGAIVKRATTSAQTNVLLQEIEELQAEIGEKIAPYKGGIREYNELNPKDPIPFTIIVVHDITHPGFDSRAVSLLSQRMRNAALMGMQALVLSDAYEIGESKNEILDEMRDKYFRTVAEVSTGDLYIQEANGQLAQIRMLTEAHSTPEFIRSFVDACAEISLMPEDTAPTGLPSLDEVPVYPSTEGIEIPIGFYEDGSVASLKFGSVLGGQYAEYAHGIITGGTGSGKTTFIRNLIQSACSHYSPEEFELWLVDYKAEMTTFCDLGHRFPQFGLIGLDRSLDFAKGFMDYLEKEYERRRVLVSEPSSKGLLNRNDISDYNEWARANGRDILPRLLIIVDEFHVQSNFMKPPDGFIEWRTIFENLLREVRSFGINILLVDQDINGLSGLTESGQKQLGMRATVGVNPGSTLELRTLFGSAHNVNDAMQIATSMKHQVLLMDSKSNMVAHVTQLRDCDWNSIADAVTSIEEKYSGQRRDAKIYNANDVVDVPLEDIKPSGENLYPIGTIPSFVNSQFELRLPNKSRQNVFALGSADAHLPFDVVSLMAYTAWKDFGYRVCLIGVEDCNIYDETYEAWEELNEDYMDDELEIFETIPEINAFLGGVDDLTHTFVIIVGLDELDAAMNGLPPRKAGAPAPKQDDRHDKVLELTALFGGTEYQQPVQEERHAEQDEVNDMPNVYKLLTASKSQDLHVAVLDDSYPNLMKMFREERRREFDKLFPHAFATKPDATSADFPPNMKAAGRSLDDSDARSKMIYLDPRKSTHTITPYAVPWDATLRRR